jgi:hypothetical protein
MAMADAKALRKTVQESCALTERDESFVYTYGGVGGDAVGGCVCLSLCRSWLLGVRSIGVLDHGPHPHHHHPTRQQGQGDEEDATHVIRLQGWKKELGQQLDSTGLTMWRAGEDLGRYLYERREALFGGRRGGRHVLELGCGLGLCGILAARLNPHGVVVLTDGDELTMDKVGDVDGMRVRMTHLLALTTNARTHARTIQPTAERQRGGQRRGERLRRHDAAAAVGGARRAAAGVPRQV